MDSSASPSILSHRFSSQAPTSDMLPSISFSPPSHASSLYPVTTFDSAEFLPSPTIYSSNYNKKTPISSDGQRLIYPQTYMSSTDDLSHNDASSKNIKPTAYSAPSTTLLQHENLFRFSGHPLERSPDPQPYSTNNVSPHYSTDLEAGGSGRTLDDTEAKRPLQVSSVRFQCKGRSGYYGDQDFDCKVFHFCSHDGKRFTFRCGNGLSFDEVRLCSKILFSLIESE